MGSTLSVYRGAEEYLNKVVFAEWQNFSSMGGGKAQVNYVASLISLVRLLPRKRSACAPYPCQRHFKKKPPL